MFDTTTFKKFYRAKHAKLAKKLRIPFPSFLIVFSLASPSTLLRHALRSLREALFP